MERPYYTLKLFKLFKFSQFFPSFLTFGKQNKKSGETFR